jgi:hypothetical protein
LYTAYSSTTSKGAPAGWTVHGALPPLIPHARHARNPRTFRRHLLSPRASAAVSHVFPPLRTVICSVEPNICLALKAQDVTILQRLLYFSYLKLSKRLYFLQGKSAILSRRLWYS